MKVFLIRRKFLPKKIITENATDENEEEEEKEYDEKNRKTPKKYPYQNETKRLQKKTDDLSTIY